LFDTDSSYQQLDEQKRLTLLKISELPYVLEHSELPLHNNLAELAPRTMYGAGTQYCLATILYEESAINPFSS
jgi:hypothetical protein